MNPAVMRRFIILMAIATFAGFTFWMFRDYLNPPPGDYEVRKGDIHLSSNEFADAIEDFDDALLVQPNHRGALMGRAIALAQLNRVEEAEAAYDYLITFLNDQPSLLDDPTAIGLLAAAYANRGILKDLNGRHQEALDDYIRSLEIDRETVSGPGLIHKIISEARPSTVRDRAQYLWEQFQLPEEQRVLRLPEKDSAQRMYKP